MGIEPILQPWKGRVLVQYTTLAKWWHEPELNRWLPKEHVVSNHAELSSNSIMPMNGGVSRSRTDTAFASQFSRLDAMPMVITPLNLEK